MPILLFIFLSYIVAVTLAGGRDMACGFECFMVTVKIMLAF